MTVPGRPRCAGRTRRILPCLCLALLAAGCAASPPIAPGGGAEGPAAPGAIVACYDTDRDVVIQLPAGLCRGEIVDERTAAELEAARSMRVQAAAGKFGLGPATSDRWLAGSGTGLLIGRGGGTVLTNFHVVRNCAVISVTATDGTNARATIQAQDREMDLAALSSRLEGRTTAVFNGEPGSASPYHLSVIGFPLQGVPTILSSLTPAVARSQDLASDMPQFLVGGAVEPGHSGSPLVDQSGNVIGLVKAKIDSVEFYRKTGQLVDDVGLVISNARIFDFLEAHGITFQAEPSTKTLTDDEILAKARKFVVRISCWR